MLNNRNVKRDLECKTRKGINWCSRLNEDLSLINLKDAIDWKNKKLLAVLCVNRCNKD